MKSTLRLIATAVLGVLCYAGAGFASTAIDFSGTTIDWNDGNNYSLGWSFTVGSSDLKVNSLGVYAAPEFGTGNRIFLDDTTNRTHAVGIFDSTGNLLTSTTVSNNDGLNGFFRYHALDNKLTLTAGNTYYIAAAMGADQYTWNTTNFSVNPLITYNGSYYHSAATSSLLFPETADATTGDQAILNGTLGPNMDVTPTPIPAAFWLLGSGIGMIGAIRRRMA